VRRWHPDVHDADVGLVLVDRPQQLVGIVDALPDFYASWEQWAAEVSESHVSYPVLLLFRSPDPWSSWVRPRSAARRCWQSSRGARARVS